uniref:Holin n=1 Tax=Siphoviridae sp. ctFy320 TaxID=2826217 RepID=A0A8S5LW71_9CAUD|nr:MAG TPA: holin [Siphoviridae sp. ctFy320]
MDYTQIISAVIALISALVSAFLIPWLKTKIDANKLQTIKTYVEIGVKAAEQLYTATDGEEKKAYVINFLAEHGIRFDVSTINQLIEAAVLQLHHELYGSERA